MTDADKQRISALEAENAELRRLLAAVRITPGDCHADDMGDCFWAQCPQHRDNEPFYSRRLCPLSKPTTR